MLFLCGKFCHQLDDSCTEYCHQVGCSAFGQCDELFFDHMVVMHLLQEILSKCQLVSSRVHFPIS
jgi:hypothetical protein